MLGPLSTMRGTPHDMIKIADMMHARSHYSIDYGYIKTLLFPELYNADIPQPLSTQSYCRFTDKKDISIYSGGSGMLLWYPKVNVGPSLFLYTGTTPPTSFDMSATKWLGGAFQDYSPYFSQTNLVAASISIQYIGQLQLEQGYFVGSQLYGVHPKNISTDEIENGQFRVMAKPGDGIRLTYMPKDTSDFIYCSCNQNVVNYTGADGVAGTCIRSHNAGNKSDGEQVMIPSDITKLDATCFINGQMPTWPTNGAAAPANVRLSYQAEGDIIAIYWQGLATQTVVAPNKPSSDLRIDIVRKFNGFPLAKQRDILDLTKPKKIFDPKKTIEVIQELQTAIPSLMGHSLKQMDRVSDQIQEFLPNVGHLYNEGMLKEGTSLDGFAQQLQMIAGTEGPATSMPGRIYDY